MTTIAYDDLDRPLSKMLPPGGLSADDVTLFAADHENYLWDYGVVGHEGNYKDRLTTWYTHALNGTPSISINNQYDALGNLIIPQDTLNSIAGYPTLTRKVLRSYNLASQLSYTNFEDLFGSSYTTASYYYDQRGLPSYVYTYRVSSGGAENVANSTRNVAGLVTKRHSDVSGSPMTYVESNWVYDKLGRVTSQVVQQGPGPVTDAEQDLRYFGNDDPATLDQQLGSDNGNRKSFQYSYDRRHQLTQATETTTQNYFSGQYFYGNAGRLATANVTGTGGPNGNFSPRTVDYQYQGDDPEEVTGLVINGNGGQDAGMQFTSYTYDESGNETMRCYGTIATDVCSGASDTYVYDGKDQLRRATHRNAQQAVTGIEEYWYDADGNRMVKVTRDAEGSPTELIWWMGDVEAHYDGSGALTKVYDYVTEGGVPVARIDRTSASSAPLEFQFQGMAGSTLATVDKATGTVNASFTYEPFGELLEATDAGSGQNEGVAAHRRRMNDKYVDELTGLAYYGARYYDNVSMTWTQGDPLYRFAPDSAWTAPRRANLYTNDLNNPLKYMDPDGREPHTYPGAPSIHGPGLLEVPSMKEFKQQQEVKKVVKLKLEQVRAMHKGVPSDDLVGHLLGVHNIEDPIYRALEGRKSTGGITAPPLPDLPDVSDFTPHGNSLTSTKPQHRYEISDDTGDVVKTGISGQDLNANGSSPRANRQVNALNREEGAGKYSSQVKETDIPGRKAALDNEQQATNKLKSDGNSLRLQKKPTPQ